jgi:hypothetical protein
MLVKFKNRDKKELEFVEVGYLVMKNVKQKHNELPIFSIWPIIPPADITTYHSSTLEDFTMKTVYCTFSEKVPGISTPMDRYHLNKYSSNGTGICLKYLDRSMIMWRSFTVELTMTLLLHTTG